MVADKDIGRRRLEHRRARGVACVCASFGLALVVFLFTTRHIHSRMLENTSIKRMSRHTTLHLSRCYGAPPVL